MLKIYLILIVLGVLGGVGYGAVAYYNDTQQRIQTLSENNAKLETALQTSEASIEALQEDMAKFAEANKKLQADLQKAEAYGDELRSKFSRFNLVQEALTNPEKLEGSMNGATAKLWREIVADTGGTPDSDLPNWLQPREQAGTGSEGSDSGREDESTDSSETETSSAD